MHADWIKIPEQQNDFTALSSASIVSVLDDYGVLAIDGIDSAKFLQGQLTCNMQDITLTQGSRGAHCSNKGRAIATFFLSQVGEHRYQFFLPKPVVPVLQKSLSKYIVFSKAKLHDVSEDFLLLGISGLHAVEKIKDLWGSVPVGKDAQISGEQGTVSCVAENPARFLCCIPAAHAQAVYARLSAGSSVVTGHYWRWLDIVDGLGEVLAGTVEEFIPQMLNLQLVGGVSFTKGCYTGQEIVARMQYRGTLKKAMYRLGGDGVAPAPNAPVFRGGEAQAVGHVVMAENIAVNSWEALAVISHEALTEALHTENSAPVRLLVLPYAVPAGEQK
ncbi:MAG TPA: hypothetical protein PLF22_01890 [Pseudomonadales bacterium]|nr:hypothetical protein [Pseudomonadales bacterium]